ncbi:hypothetical protein CTI12_AA535330 [Artemisia annua]|uniref:Uncharacterized protein n=1 Tax=Artemisia annua TaxID=35608 RepID=A0A2U1L1G7_ARTAN|nr:hypothetical protein CTI12_AA535330 [Artemisia annua]
MASTLAKLVASNLLRARQVASSSRFLNTKAFQYVQHDSADQCILRCGHKHGSFLHDVVNCAFSPLYSPTGNLAYLLHTADVTIGLRHGPEVLPMWTAVEDDKALYLFRDTTGKHKTSIMESIREMKFITGIHEKDVMDYFPNNETVKKRDLRPIRDLMRGVKSEVKSEPCEYYYHVMQDAEELDDVVGSMADYMLGTRMRGFVQIKANVYVSGVHYNPQAVYIIVGVGTPDTREFYVGYAIEIFADDSFYNAMDVVRDITSEAWKIMIPKKRREQIQTIGGNLIFFCEKKICKPTLWRAT